MNNIINRLAEKYQKELVDIRRDIHAHPELGLEETRTSRLVAKVLTSLNIECEQNIGITGVVGILRGKAPGKTIMLRADMDALSMEELNDTDYRSKISGRMHACGHDAHTAWLLGAAMILNELKDSFNGTVKFAFQPAEEGKGGAGKMILDGLMNNPKVDAVFGAHVWPSLSSGDIGIKYNELMAAPTKFTIKVIGKGGHGAEPHNTVDPIAIGCQIYMSLQTIISRKINPTEPVVLSVTQFHGGTAHNIIPDEVILSGTVRTFSPEMNKTVKDLMESTAKGIVELNGANYEFEYNTYYPPVVNDKEMTDLLKKSASSVLGADHVKIMESPSMAGEDFAYYQREVPGVFFMVGTKNSDKGVVYPLHSPYFDIDESILSKASAVMAKAAIDFLGS